MSLLVPMLPTQQWILNRKMANLGNYNMICAFKVAPEFTVQEIIGAITRVVEQNEALRMRFVQSSDGWCQYCDGHVCRGQVTWVDVPDDADGTINRMVQQLRLNLDVGRPPIIRVGLVRTRQPSGTRVVIVLSHLIFDGFSRPLFLTELGAILKGSERKRGLLPKLTTLREWACQLRRYANSADGEKEFRYWKSLPWDRVRDLRSDFADGRPNTYASSAEVKVELADEAARALTVRGPFAFPAVLGAFARAYCQTFATDAVLIDVTYNGRDMIFPNLDVRKTIGCFTVNTPLLLVPTPNPQRRDADLRDVAGHLGRLPMRGIGYGALRYFSDDVEKRSYLARRPHPPVKFNFRGPRPHVPPGPIYSLSVDLPGVMDPTDAREYMLNVDVFSTPGGGRMMYKFSHNLHRECTIRTLACRCLRNIIAAVVP